MISDCKTDSILTSEKKNTTLSQYTSATFQSGWRTEFQLMRLSVEGSSTSFQSFPRNAGTVEELSPTECIWIKIGVESWQLNFCTGAKRREKLHAYEFIIVQLSSV